MVNNDSVNDKPRLISFPKIGKPSLGYISVAENENLPFQVNRIYWTYFTPEDVETYLKAEGLKGVEWKATDVTIEDCFIKRLND